MSVSLNRRSILAAGQALVRREGLEALGVRSVAVEMGATPMALYRYVADVSDLHDSVLSLLLDASPAPPESIEDLESWAHQLRAWLAETPGLARFVLLHWFELPPMLDTVERLLEILGREGFNDFDLVATSNSLFTYVLARGEIEEAVRSAGVHRTLPWTRDPDDHPLLKSNRRHYEVAHLEEHFAFGLDLLVAHARHPEQTQRW